MLATAFYGVATDALAGSGPNAAWLYLSLVMSAGFAWGAKDFESNYGKFSDPSKRQLKEGKVSML